MLAIVQSGKLGPTCTPLLLATANMDIFYDNSVHFEKFLRANNAYEKAKGHGLRIRIKNKIHTKVRYHRQIFFHTL